VPSLESAHWAAGLVQPPVQACWAQGCRTIQQARRPQARAQTRGTAPQALPALLAVLLGTAKSAVPSLWAVRVPAHQPTLAVAPEAVLVLVRQHLASSQGIAQQVVRAQLDGTVARVRIQQTARWTKSHLRRTDHLVA